VFAVASDGRTMSNWWDQASGWAGWFHVQGGISSPGGAGSQVTAIARYAGHLDLFTVGTDNRVYSAWWDQSNGWHGWFPIGTLSCRPGSVVNVVARYADHLDLFWRGSFRAEELHDGLATVQAGARTFEATVMEYGLIARSPTREHIPQSTNQV
jgi:hypothetical protein